ncbi:hypothetical protein, variant [Aphanomyces astaci]|uniref:Uncharacterized protein n=1 Tax=Aphanomyces astaci TaxID=112090 RepID=W4FZ93_APHAT|nr:hypothetical protein, variant [Aphanomyces astaci]ETV72084.1 hypothetical protein, variant [Aphanomyces astaci]|eukprot:XP_009838527.1 hypothetical protein, variant [Aphanomyces astaci]
MEKGGGAVDAKQWELMTLYMETLHKKGDLTDLTACATSINDALERVLGQTPNWANMYYVTIMRCMYRQMILRMTLNAPLQSDGDIVVRFCRLVLREGSCPPSLRSQAMSLLYDACASCASRVMHVLGVDSFQRNESTAEFSCACRGLDELLSCMAGSGKSFEFIYTSLDNGTTSVRLADVVNDLLSSGLSKSRTMGSSLLFRIILDSTQAQASKVLGVLFDCADVEVDARVHAHVLGLVWEVLDLRRDLLDDNSWSAVSTSLRHPSPLVTSMAAYSAMRLLLCDAKHDSKIAGSMLGDLVTIYVHHSLSLTQPVLQLMFQFFHDHYGATHSQSLIVSHYVLYRNQLVRAIYIDTFTTLGGFIINIILLGCL